MGKKNGDDHYRKKVNLMIRENNIFKASIYHNIIY